MKERLLKKIIPEKGTMSLGNLFALGGVIVAAAFAYSDGFGLMDDEAPYRGSDKVPKCDVYTGNKPIPVLSTAALENEIDKLRGKLVKAHGEVAGINDIDPSQRNAVKSIFRSTSGENVVLAGENKLDDPSEVLCFAYPNNRYQIYLSPQAEIAVQGLVEAGVKVDPSLIPQPQ
jgi:hypothetical protein